MYDGEKRSEPAAELVGPLGNAPRNELERAERRHRIVRLRKRGMSYEQIAQMLAKGEDGGEPWKVARDTVRTIVHRYLDALAHEDSETVEQLRQMENERLDELLLAFGPDARRGDVKAANVVLRVAERRAKMNGLDAPVKHEHDVRGSLLKELGTDPGEVEREREAWRHAALGDVTIPDADVIDG
jgi:DNA-binding transcriptional MerR regulator